MAGGEYVAFLDSDDLLEPNFCERLYSAAVACDADLAYCHILAVKSSGRTVWRNPAVDSGDFSGGKRLYFLKNYKSYFTSFIYRREMLTREGIVFPATRSAEDSCFLTSALLCASRIAFADEPLYRYQLRSDSLSFGRLDDRYMQRMASFDALLDFARGKGLYDSDKEILDYIYIKKASFGALRNNRRARAEIIAHTDSAIPLWRRNALYRQDLRLRTALFLLSNFCF